MFFFQLLELLPHYAFQNVSYNNPIIINKSSNSQWVFVSFQYPFSTDSFKLIANDKITNLTFSHFYTNISNFTIQSQSEEQSSIIVWEIPPEFCYDNFSIIKTMEKISAHYYSNNQNPICMFSSNVGPLLFKNITASEMKVTTYINNSIQPENDSQISPFFLHLEPHSDKSEFMIKYSLSNPDNNLKEICLFERSPYYDSTSLLFPDQYSEGSYIRNCEISNNVDAWWINFSIVGAVIFVALIYSIISMFIIKSRQKSLTFLESIPEATKITDSLASIQISDPEPEIPPTNSKNILFFKRSSHVSSLDD